MSLKPTIYEAVGGYEKLLELAHTWHRLCVEDPILNHPFDRPDLHPHHSERLASYWAESLGGPKTFTESMADQTHVVRIHAGNGEHEEMDAAAELTFAVAMDEVGVAKEIRPVLEAYFHHANLIMSSYPDSPDQVPQELPMLYWSWEGQEP